MPIITITRVSYDPRENARACSTNLLLLGRLVGQPLLHRTALLLAPFLLLQIDHRRRLRALDREIHARVEARQLGR